MNIRAVALLIVSISGMLLAIQTDHDPDAPMFVIKKMLEARTFFPRSNSWLEEVSSLQPGALIRLSTTPFYDIVSKRDQFSISCDDNGIATIHASFSSKESIADCVDCFLQDNAQRKTTFTKDNQCLISGEPSPAVSFKWLVSIDYNKTYGGEGFFRTDRVDVSWRLAITDLKNLMTDLASSVNL